MKLLTHNLLMCNKKGCTINNFPLVIKCDQQSVQKFDFDSELVKRTLKKMDLPALSLATKQVKFILLNYFLTICKYKIFTFYRWALINSILKIYLLKN
jgi:hypothetical protein